MRDFMERYVLPTAMKIGNQRHLLAIRDTLIGMIAITMIGAFAVLWNNIGGALKWEKSDGTTVGYDNLMESIFGKNWHTLGGDIWWATLAFMTVFAVVGIAYKLARSYGDDGFEAMLIALACFFILVPQVGNVSVTDAAGKAITGQQWGMISFGQFSNTSLFAGIIISIIATEIFVRLAKVKYLVIKMPDGVPPAVARSFAKLFPGMFTIIFFGIFGIIFGKLTDGQFFFDWITKVLVSPMTSAADSLGFTLVVVFLIHLFWSFGLHGPNILEGVIRPLLVDLGTKNTNLYAQNVTDLSQYHVFAGRFLDAFVFLGGSGATLGLLIAMFLAARKRKKQMIALGLPPGIFQINEPILFGLPVVLNPMWVIPFMITPFVLTIISYLSVSTGLVHPIVADIPWVTPAIVGGWLATGGHLSGAILAGVNLIISIAIYFPFVMMQERADTKAAQAALANKEE